MGKYSLLLVAAFGIAGASAFLTSKETDVKASANQGSYEADVIAREIARSAYNAGAADINRHGTDIDAALLAFGAPATNCANGKAACSRRTGEMLGGTFVVEASPDGGNGVDIYASGTFGYDADRKRVERSHAINESQSVDVLQVDPSGQCGKLKIQFVDSRAGYCSAIFLQRTIDGQTLAPEMVYAPGKNRNGARNLGYEVALLPGTQMNFAIGVENTRNKSWTCDGTSSRGALPSAYRPVGGNAIRPAAETPEARSAFRTLLAAYDYDENHFDWVHWALDGPSLRAGESKEAPWAMVETDPDNDQRWRIAFEDQPLWNLDSDDPNYDNPNESLWATKRFGYDWSGSFQTKGSDGKGDGWTDSQRVQIVENAGSDEGYSVSYIGGSDGFHDLRDTGSPADFSDQVIMVEVLPAPDLCLGAVSVDIDATAGPGGVDADADASVGGVGGVGASTD